MEDVINQWYGWIRPNNLRRTKVGLLSIGRKNGKTELMSALTSYHLLADGEISPHCCSCAVDREQAGQIFEKFRWSIENNNQLKHALHITPSKKEILFPKKNGSYKSLSSDNQGKGKFGHGHTLVVYDELAFHRDDGLYTALKNSGDSRPNSLQLITSTAGWNKNGVFYRLIEYSRKILAGEIVDIGFNPFIYEVQNIDTADLESPEVWRQANPSLGLGPLSIDDYREGWNRAKIDISSRLDWTRLKNNNWTDGKDGWLPVEKWDASRGFLPEFDKSTPVYVGLDGGQVQDIFGIVCVFPVNNKYYVKSIGLVPQKAVDDRVKNNLIPYTRFTMDKSLKIVPGDCISIEDDVYPILNDIISKYNVKCVTVDKWQLRQLSQHYMKQDILFYEFTQNHANYTDPCRSLERILLDGKLVHDGNELMRWQVANAQLERNGKGYIMPKKPSPSATIDTVVALTMAMSQAVQHGNNETKPSVYTTRGLITC